MSQKSDHNDQDLVSIECSLSTKEFLQIEKSCERYKDSDEEIKLIFNEIHKLTEESRGSPGLASDSEDVGLILKRAAEISQETENLLRSCPIDLQPQQSPALEAKNVPEMTVSKPLVGDNKKPEPHHQNDKPNAATPKHAVKDANETMRRKQKNRPQSASIVDNKKKEIKVTRSLNSSPKKCQCKNTSSVIEELKDTSERCKGLELMNVQLTDDNKCLRKKLEEYMEKHHIAELKLNECEKFISKIGKEYDNRTTELKNAKESECRALAELTRERNESKNLKIQHDKDLSSIQDLKRQCKEMEMILKRKHPDSVSALIVASKQSTVDDNKKRLLEDRINRLEQELKDKEEHFQNILLTLQEKFGDMKQKYENHIIDVERQLMEERKINAELRNKISKANLVDESVQTVSKSVHTISTQTFLKSAERASSAVSRLTQNSALILNRLKEDSYLVATIKGLQSELTVKQRTIAKINRESEELRKNLRNMQKEKEVLMNINPQKKPLSKTSKSTENVSSKVSLEIEAELTDSKKHREALMQEKASLLESLKRTNEDLIMLKKKRIQDLHTLQLSHEKELMQMNLQIYPLQEEIKLLSRTVEILQERVRTADDKLIRYQSVVKDVDVHGGGDTGLCRVRR